MYYGAADSCIGMARGSVSEILAWLDDPENRVTPDPPLASNPPDR
jgi:hypothetical protein